MHIDKYRTDDGGYEDEDGVYSKTAREFLLESVLGWCGCGRPDDALLFVRDALWRIDGHIPLELDTGPAYFVYYVLDEKGLTEHGVGVPGWLTDKGRKLLEDLNEWAEQEGS